MKEAKARGIKVIANAGGVNLEACVEALRKTAQEQGVDISVAMVAGDDMMDRVSVNGDVFKNSYPPPEHLHTSLGEYCERTGSEGLRHWKRTARQSTQYECLSGVSMFQCVHMCFKCMYRAFPIAEALDLGADIVVTGRCVDSALALAPFIHKVCQMAGQTFPYKIDPSVCTVRLEKD